MAAVAAVGVGFRDKRDPPAIEPASSPVDTTKDGNLLAGLLKSTQIEDTPRNWVLRRRQDGPPKAGPWKAGKT
jgi:hypothetical protein